MNNLPLSAKHAISAYVKGIWRRHVSSLLPNQETRAYQAWMAEHMELRRTLYADPLEKGLLSILTAVWDGSPLKYLKTLANSVIRQNQDGACEWLILDNGCSNKRILSYLEQLNEHRWVKLHHGRTNLGIIGGLHYCLAHATRRYVLPVDADDYLYPDALRVITSNVRRAGYPALLYTDEDKVIGTRFYEPYFKPDWDPVLFLNSAYIAHLGVIDRERALELGAYSDQKTEGSPDWDVFMRFMIAGYIPSHIPEIVYSWRSHAKSTADDAASKPYVASSQKAVLRRFLDTRSGRANFTIEHSPLLEGAHWHFVRQHYDPRPFASVLLSDAPRTAERSSTAAALTSSEIISVQVNVEATPSSLLPLARTICEKNALLRFVGADVQIDNPHWYWEALGIFELHPDTVMVGGRIRNKNGVITEGGRHFGFGGVCGCPNRGKSSLDSGYFAQMWKQRSVSAVSTQFAVMDGKFLIELLGHIPQEASIAFLGAWAGAHAIRTGRRIVYSPLLSGVSDLDWEKLATASEQALFAEMNRDIIPDLRFYPRHFSLDKPFALRGAGGTKDA
jgi:glycosyltransferase involved in cell wall biosynthesis